MPNKYKKYSKQQKVAKQRSHTHEMVLDYHDLGPVQGFEIERKFFEFIELATAMEVKSVLIITGKGKNSPNGPVIKPLIKKLLKSTKKVAHFQQASVNNGGEGAFEVSLE